MTPPDPELLGDDPVRLGRWRDHDDDHDVAAEPAPLWRPPRWLVVIALVVALVAGIGWHADRQARAREAHGLDGCRRDLRSAAALADLRLMAMADYLDPALSTTRGARRGQIADLMSQPARRVLADVERADRGCQAVSVLPWHFGLAARRQATTAYSSGLVERLRAIAARGRRYYHPRETGALARLREAAALRVDGGRS